ncbi:HEAT repeat domain-containing protein [bacterium]|nr:HEAT repeat domain-containing protein [bacterium]
MSDMIDGLIQLILNQDADEVCRRDAIVKLGSYNDPRISETLKSIFDDRRVSVRYFAKKTYNEIMKRNESSCEGIVKTYHAKKQAEDYSNLAPSEQVIKIKESIETATSRKEYATRVIKLGETRDPSAINVLAEYLKSDLPRVRSNAVEALEMIPGNSFVDLVIPLREDEDNRTRANVAKFLWKKEKHDIALEILEKMIKGDFVWMKDSAIYVLRLIEDVRSLPLLELALCDHDENIRVKAIKYLKELDMILHSDIKKEMMGKVNPKKKVLNKTKPDVKSGFVNKIKSIFNKN